LPRPARGGRARVARPPRLDLSAHASALAAAGADVSRRARASASRTRPSADSVSPTGNIHKKLPPQASTSKIGPQRARTSRRTCQSKNSAQRPGPTARGSASNIAFTRIRRARGSSRCPRRARGPPAAAAMRWTLPCVKLRDGVHRREIARAVSRRVDTRALHAIAARRLCGGRGLHDLHAPPRPQARHGQ
jgi:hypothetical protein